MSKNAFYWRHLRPRSGTGPGNCPGVAGCTNAHDKLRNPRQGGCVTIGASVIGTDAIDREKVISGGVSGEGGDLSFYPILQLNMINVLKIF